jgi:hypothetical protein
VSGIVHGADAKPMAGVTVVCRRAGGVASQERSNEDGRFRFDGLMAGPVELRAIVFSEDSVPRAQRWTPYSTVQAGADGIVLTLPR